MAASAPISPSNFAGTPSSAVLGGATGLPQVSTGLVPTNMTQPGANPLMLPVGTPIVGQNTMTPTSSGMVPVTGAATGLNAGLNTDLSSVYGQGTGTAISSLLSSESAGTANSAAQAVINANKPQVAQGSANLNQALAASGIGPSSSVSAIENANYQAGVAGQDASTIAQFNLQEQQQQQQLLESLMPQQAQRQVDSSGWTMFGDVMTGLGDLTGNKGMQSAGGAFSKLGGTVVPSE